MTNFHSNYKQSFYALFKHGIVISCQGKHTIKLKHDLYDLHQSLALFSTIWN